MIGEEVFALEKTISALSNNFLNLEIEKKDVKIDEMLENDEELLVISGKGIAKSFDGGGVQFIVSFKFYEGKIMESKMKLFWG